ncbi:MAG: hypothetical protein RL033_2366 [Pseudomonadota bacterium]
MAVAGLVLVAALAAFLLLRRLTADPWPRWLLLPGLLLAGGLAASRPDAEAMRASDRTEQAQGIQTAPTLPGYATSASCRSCHPGEYQSWHDSFHRSMTERTQGEGVRAPWQGRIADGEGDELRLFRRDEQLWVELPDPDLRAARGRVERTEPNTRHAALPRVERQVLMTTGSHHYQGYWVQGARGNELWQLPVVYHFESQRFLPRRAVFLEPPDDPPVWARWNSSCVMCHSVAGQPQHDLESDRFATRAAELGIACEACHGPAQEHVARQHNPLVRYQTRRSESGDPSIVQPARLPAPRASEICGQCHSYFVPSDAERWWQDGFTSSYHPGQPLAGSRRVLDYERDRQQAAALVGADLESLFYTDGTVKVGGREYNGLLRSACFQRGQGERQLSCLSCHSMHQGTRDAQLSAEGQTNAACSNCHASHATGLAQHTHHAPESSGSACVNCHMPYTSYALLGAVRSHRITSPRAEPDRSGLAPHACNSCHLDRSQGWTEQWLQRWYGGEAMTASAPALSSADRRWSAAALSLARGDAATRVVVAWQLGWGAARPLSTQRWQAQLLAEALDDPYAAVRFVAYRSLRSLPSFADFSYDFLSPAAERREAQARAIERLPSVPAQTAGQPAPDLPLNEAGLIEPAFLTEWLAARDLRPVRIAE